MRRNESKTKKKKNFVEFLPSPAVSDRQPKRPVDVSFDTGATRIFNFFLTGFGGVVKHLFSDELSWGIRT